MSDGHVREARSRVTDGQPHPAPAVATARDGVARDPAPSALWELTMLRVRGFLREPEALFWTFVFPIIMAVGLGIAFREQPADVARIAVERGSVAERYLPFVRATGQIEARVLDAPDAERALARGEVAVVLRGDDTLRYQYDPSRPESRSARLLTDVAIQAGAGGTRPVVTADDEMRRPGTRYIDWVIPGLIGLNLMSTGMWGIGFNLVYMRQKKQLKRLVATPMRRSDFLLSQILARLTFVLLEVPPIVLFAWLAFGVEVEGSVLAMSAIVLLGAMVFSGLGLLASARARTIEGVSGIMNVVMLPMFVLSGVFFSASRFPDVIQPLIRALPLTALNDALRTVYNDGLPLTAAAIPLAILVGWMLVSFLLALRWFRWQ
jgi:ABC-2 type transport system permease protein